MKGSFKEVYNKGSIIEFYNVGAVASTVVGALVYGLLCRVGHVVVRAYFFMLLALCAGALFPKP